MTAFAVGLLVRAWALRALPAMHDGDSYDRVANPRELVKAVWLPGYQLTLAAASWFSEDPDRLRWVTLFEGALACAAAAWCATVWAGPAAGLFAGIAIAVLPPHVALSVQAYQEPLFTALLFAIGARVRTHGARDVLTCGFAAAACLTRYEGWLLVPVLAFAAGRSRWSLAYLLAPLGWLVYSRGWSPVGASALHVSFSPARLVERLELIVEAIHATHSTPLALMGLAGVAWAAIHRDRRAAGLLGCLAVYVGFLSVLDPYWPSGNWRQVLVPACLCALGGALGVARLPPLGVALTSLCLLATAWGVPAQVEAQYDENASRLVATARALADVPGPVLVLAEGLEAYPDATPLACLVFRAYGGDVVCDVEGDAADRLRRDEPAAVVRAGAFLDWREVHRDTTASLAIEGEWVPELIAPVAVWVRPSLAGSVWPRLAGALADRNAPGTCLPERAHGITGATVVGAAVADEGTRLALYTVGTVRWATPSAGRLLVFGCGTPADGKFPHVSIRTPHQQVVQAVGPTFTPIDVGAVEAGDLVELRFEDDATDTAGGDRNVFVGAAVVIGSAIAPTGAALPAGLPRGDAAR